MLDSDVGLAAPYAAFREIKSLNDVVPWSSSGEEELLELQDVVMDSRPNPEEEMFCTQLRKLVLSAFWLLSPSQKRVAHLYFIRNKDKADIARQLGMSRSAVTQSMKKIEKKLQKSVLPELEYKAA